MHLFKNECLHDTGFTPHDLAFRRPTFGERYRRRPRTAAPGFALATPPWLDDDAVDLASANSACPRHGHQFDD